MQFGARWLFRFVVLEQKTKWNQDETKKMNAKNRGINKQIGNWINNLALCDGRTKKSANSVSSLKHVMLENVSVDKLKSAKYRNAFSHHLSG